MEEAEKMYNSVRKILVILVFTIATSCTSFVNRESTIRIESLQVDISAFPQGWTIDPTGTSGGDALAGGYTEISRSTASFSSAYGFAFQDIYEYSANSAASEKYDKGLNNVFSEDENGDAWNNPFAGSPLPAATSSRVACKEIGNRDNCRVLAQYGMFITEFVISVVSPINIAEFQEILEDIDSKMQRVYQ